MNRKNKLKSSSLFPIPCSLFPCFLKGEKDINLAKIGKRMKGREFTR